MNELISNFLKDSLVSDFGFAYVEDSPFESLNNAVSMVFHLSEAIVDQIDGAPTYTYFHHYRTMNSYIDSVSNRLVLLIQSRGFSAAAVPASQSVDTFAAIFSHKKAAVRAGLGQIGKSALFISDKFGPRVRLGTVFTDAPIETKSCKIEDKCGSCNICSVKCGALAIKNIAFREGMKREDIFDAKACSEYMKKKFQHIGRGAVCGVCMKVCPKNKR